MQVFAISTEDFSPSPYNLHFCRATTGTTTRRRCPLSLQTATESVGRGRSSQRTPEAAQKISQNWGYKCVHVQEHFMQKNSSMFLYCFLSVGMWVNSHVEPLYILCPDNRSRHVYLLSKPHTSHALPKVHHSSWFMWSQWLPYAWSGSTSHFRLFVSVNFYAPYARDQLKSSVLTT